MVSETPLREGDIYFTIDYADEAMLYPSVRAYVYLGTGVPSGAEVARTHLFQTTETYYDSGNWADMSGADRDRLGPDAVICCDEGDVDLFSDVSDLIRQLKEFKERTDRARTPNHLERP